MSLSKILKLTVGAMVLSLVLPGVVLAANYVPPTQMPPNCSDGAPGCDAPIHTGAVAQIKKGPLSINQLLAVFNNAAGGVASFFFSNNALTNGAIGKVGEVKFLDNTGGANTAAEITVSKDATGFNNHTLKIVTGAFNGPRAEGITLKDTQVGVGTSVIPANLRMVAQGRMGATEYCDVAGENCFAPSAVAGVGGDSLWAASKVDVSNIYNTNSGNVGIGTNNPAEKLTVITGVKGARISDNTSNDPSQPGAGAVIGRNGNGIEAYTFYNALDQKAGSVAVNASAEGDNGVGFLGHAYGSGITYGSKSIAGTVGAFNRGRIGLYATNKGSLPTSNPNDEGWYAPSNVLYGPSYAAVINGPMWVGDTLASSVNPNTAVVAAGSGMIVASTSGNGVEAYTFHNGAGAVSAYAGGAAGIAVLGQASGQNSYGAKFVGSYANFIRGDKIGLYASNQPGEVAIPAAVASGPSYAAFVNGPAKFSATSGGAAITNALHVGPVFPGVNGGYVGLGFTADPTNTTYSLTGDNTNTWLHAPSALWLGAGASQQTVGINASGLAVFGALSVSGNLTVRDGTQGSGKVLADNGNGVASWKEVMPNRAGGVIQKVVVPATGSGSAVCPQKMLMAGVDYNNGRVTNLICVPLVVQ